MRRFASNSLEQVVVKQLHLGEQYLTEKNYEEVIEAFVSNGA